MKDYVIAFLFFLQMSEVGLLKKPQLRGLLQTQIKRNLLVCAVFSISVGAAIKFLIAEPRKQRYAEFYK